MRKQNNGNRDNRIITGSKVSVRNDDVNSAFDMAVICITTVIPLMLNGFFAGRLFFKPEIMFILYTQIIFVFQSEHLQSMKKKMLDA